MENQTITMIDIFDFELVAHELAHSWFGDLVTCNDWQNIWVNEGIASYLEYYADEVLYPENANKWLSKCFSNAVHNPETSVFVPDEDKWKDRRIFSYYDSYRKGAAVIHMLRSKINNDSAFFKVLHVYLKQYSFSNASIDDFKTVAEKVTSLELDTFFNQWLYGKGYPVIDIKGEAKNKHLSLSIKQTSSSNENIFTGIMLEAKLKFKSKPDTILRLDVSNKDQLFNFRLNDLVTEVILNPNFSLLGRFNKDIAIDSIYNITKAVVSPNPFFDHLCIDFPDTGKQKSVELFDTNGRTVGEWVSPNTNIDLMLNNITAGPYFLLTDDGNTTSKIKVIKIN
jgi:aminopeptidase N